MDKQFIVMDRILYMDNNNGNVEITTGGRNIKAFKELYSLDKTSGKTYFKKWIGFIYYMYHKKSVFYNIDQEELRAKKIMEMIYDEGRDSSTKLIEKTREASLVFIDMHYLASERQLINHYRDIGEHKKIMQSIPWKKKVIETVSNDDGDKVTREYYIDNSKEKLQALKNHAELLQHSELIERDIERERRQNKKKDLSADKKTLIEQEHSR
jgi:hypothetical protein